MNNVTLKNLEEAHENHYAPRNMILILSGKFSDSNVETVLKDFQDRGNSSSIYGKNNSVEVGKPIKQTVMRRSGITQAYLCFGLRTPPARDNDVPVLDLIDAVLGMGESSRLFVELREKRALTYDFDSINTSGSDYGYFLISCAAKKSSLEQTRTIIRDELQEMKTCLVPKIELEKSKNLILAEIFRAFDSPHQLPRFLTELEIYYENENAVVDYIERLKSISELTVVEVSGKYFEEKNYSEAIMVPKK